METFISVIVCLFVGVILNIFANRFFDSKSDNADKKLSQRIKDNNRKSEEEARFIRKLAERSERISESVSERTDTAERAVTEAEGLIREASEDADRAEELIGGIEQILDEAEKKQQN